MFRADFLSPGRQISGPCRRSIANVRDAIRRRRFAFRLIPVGLEPRVSWATLELGWRSVEVDRLGRARLVEARPPDLARALVLRQREAEGRAEPQIHLFEPLQRIDQ